MTFMMYFALIGDLINSKSLPNRSEVQDILNSCLVRLNQDYETVLASKFSVTLGDEFQGLLKMEAPIFLIIDQIETALLPYNIRFGLGVGEIKTSINPEQSLGADGPAYWYAREAINHIHQKNDYGNTQIAVRCKEPLTTEVVNSLISAGEAIKVNWRASQRITLDELLELGIYDERFDQQLLSDKLKLSSSALSKRLKSSSLKVYLRTRKTALTVLRENSRMKEEEQ